MTDGDAPGTAPQPASDEPSPANRIILYSQAYIAIMEEASAALPGETIGLLLGSDQVAPTGELWITIKDVEAVSLALNTTTDPLPSDLQSLVERARKNLSGANVVGWFYADPALSATSPRIPPDRLQHYLHPSAALFLLVNPIAGQGAFYWWDGTHYEPSDLFYEAVPNEASSPVVAWDGNVQGAAHWFGTLLTPNHSPALSSVTPDETSQPVEPAPALTGEQDAFAARVIEAPSTDTEDSAHLSAPIYVEMITEEPVEYVTSDTGTKPHLVTADLTPLTSAEPDAPPSPREAPSTGPLGSLTDKLGPSPGEQPVSPLVENPFHSSAQTGPLEPLASASPISQPQQNGPITGKLLSDDREEAEGPATRRSPRTAPLGALVPVAHSRVRPVMRKRDWREVALTLIGLLAIALILISLLTGLPAQQGQDPSAGSFATAPPITVQPDLPPAALPTLPLTLTPTIISLPPR